MRYDVEAEPAEGVGMKEEQNLRICDVMSRVSMVKYLQGENHGLGPVICLAQPPSPDAIVLFGQ